MLARILVFCCVVAIRIYRAIVRPRRQRCCLFREGCSAFVERLLVEEGLRAGLRGLRWRYRVCRAGYSMSMIPGAISLRLLDGTVLNAGEVSPTVVAEIAQVAQLANT